MNFNLDLVYLNNNPNSIIDYLTKIWKDDEPTHYKEFLDICMKIVTGTEKPEAFFKELSDKKLLNFGACETTWSFGDTAYKCRTCQLDPTSALCTACFKEGDHEGHDYALQSVGGGFCDCGDPTAFKPSGFCSRHKEQKIDVTKYPERFILAMSFVVQFILKKIYIFYDKDNTLLFDSFMEWLLKMAQRGDIIKVIVIKYISNTDIGNTHLLPPSPFQTPLIQLFYSPDLHQTVSRSMKETIANFCVFLRGSVEFIESFIKLILPIYKKCITESKKHILLTSYSIFSSTAMGNLLLQQNAAEIVMETINEFFYKYFYLRTDSANKKKKDHFKDPYLYPQYKQLTVLYDVPQAVSVLRTDISFILSNSSVASSVIKSKQLLSLWFNVIGIAQGMNPNVQTRGTNTDDWVPAFNIDISFSNTIFPIINAIPLDKASLDQFLLFSTQYLGKWILGWLEYRNNYLVQKQEKQKKQQFILENNDEEENKEKDSTTTESSATTATHYLNNVKQLLSLHIKKEGFSFHLPLHRVVSSILFKCINSSLGKEFKSQGGLKALFSQIIGQDSLISISDYAKGSSYHPFRILAALGEIRSGMWKSHGREEDMSLQTIIYQSLHYQKYYDLDIFLVQISSVIMGPNQFLNHALSIYNLEDWFEIENNNLNKSIDGTPVLPPQTPTKSLRQSSGAVKTVDTTNTTTSTTTTTTTTTTEGGEKKETKEEKKIRKEKQKIEENLQKRKSLSEDFLQAVIMLSTNKLMCGMTDEQIIRKELIHRLCLGDSTHSQLTKAIKKKLVHHQNFENILKEISTFQTPQKTEQGKYQLKEQFWSEFDPYFAHYNTQDIQSAEERYSEFTNKTKTNIARGTYIQYPTLPCLEDLDTILCSKVLHQILFIVLQNQLVGSAKSTDTLFTHALHALDLCINQTLSNAELKAEASEAPMTVPTPSKLVKSTSQQLNTSTTVPKNHSEIDFPSKKNIFINASVDIQVSEQKRLSLILLLVKLSSSQQVNADQKQHIQNIINTLMENNFNCKQTVENYWIAIKAKKQPQSSRKEDPEEEKKRLARARQAAILAQMKSQQSAFKFEEGEDEDYEDEDYGVKDKKPKESNALVVDGHESTTTCALCREPGSIDRPMGRVAFIQPSSILMLSKLTPEERKQRITEAIKKDLVDSGASPINTNHQHQNNNNNSNNTNGDQPNQINNATNTNTGIPLLLPNQVIGGLADYINTGAEEMDDEDLADVDNMMGGGDDEEDDSEDEVNKAISFLNRVSHSNDFFGFMGDEMDIEGDDDDNDEEDEMEDDGEGEEIENEDDDEEGSDDDSDSGSIIVDESDDEFGFGDNLNDESDAELEDFEEYDEDDEDSIFEHLSRASRGAHRLGRNQRTGVGHGNVAMGPNQTNELAQTLLRALQRINPNNQNNNNILNDIQNQLSSGASRIQIQARNHNNRPIPNFDVQQFLNQVSNGGDINIRINNNGRTTNTTLQSLNNNNNNDNNNNDSNNNNNNGNNNTTARAASSQPQEVITIDSDSDNDGMDDIIEDDSDEDDIDDFFDNNSFDDMDNNVLLKYDSTTEPLTGDPWSNKFSKQEIFRNTEESVNLNLSFCGHQIHESCFSEYAWSLIKNNEGGELVNPDKNEFLCVLCRRIGNAIVPVVPDSSFSNDLHCQHVITPKMARENSKNKDIIAYSEFYHSLGRRLTGKDEEYKKLLDSPSPQSLRNIRQPIDQFATRIYGVRYNLDFYTSKSDSTVSPFLNSALASTIAGTELSIRVPDPDVITQPNEYPLFKMSDSNRIDIRSLFRYIIAHSHLYPTQQYQGNLLWQSISGSHQTQLLPTPEEEEEEEQQKLKQQEEESKKNEESSGSKKEKKEKPRDYPEIYNQGVYGESFPPLLSLDLFHTFIQVFIRYADTDLPINVEKFYMVARMFYDASITQSILQHFQTTDSSFESTDEFTNNVNKLISTTYETVQPIQSIPNEHLQSIKQNSLIFLRRLSLFLFSCLKVDPIKSYTNGDLSLDNEVNYLVDYLNLPQFENQVLDILNSLISHTEKVPLVSTWVEQLLFISAITSSVEDVNKDESNKTTTTTTTPNNNNQQLVTTKKSSILPSPVTPNPFLLIKLPDQYNAVSQYYSLIPCLQCKTISSNQAVCLVCGTLCCLGGCCKRFFDQKSECILHAERCNAGTGIFLLIKTSSTLLIHIPRKTFWISPYLDDHGEEDPNLRRGRPLFLNANRYNQLNSLLVKHQIDQDSKIAENTSREF